MKVNTKTVAFLSLLFCSVCQSGAAVVQFGLEGLGGSGLLTTNETNGASGSGSGGILGGISLDTDTNILTINVGWGSGNGFTDLTGTVTGMHIHGATSTGAAGFSQNAGVIQGLNGLAGFDGSATSGGFFGTVALSPENAAIVLNEQAYLNVHTAANAGGEIRGQLLQVPEPSSLVMVGLGSVIAFRRRRR